MSINKNYFVITGYDLTGFKTEKYEDWKWTEEGEKYTLYQSKGHTQLFDDPMNDEHFYFGYILATGDEYEFETVKLSDGDFIFNNCLEELKYLIDIGVVNKDVLVSRDFSREIIIFEECY